MDLKKVIVKDEELYNRTWGLSESEASCVEPKEVECKNCGLSG